MALKDKGGFDLGGRLTKKSVQESTDTLTPFLISIFVNYYITIPYCVASKLSSTFTSTSAITACSPSTTIV